jgi:hypothetical protein
MTRINCSIPVVTLNNRHLMAEHREIKRVCYRLKQRLESGKFSDIPAPFHEMKGDVIAFKELFWLDKGEFTLKRYKQLYDECKLRGFNVTDYSENWNIYKLKPEYFKDYAPTDEQNQMIQNRIDERNHKV